MNVQKKTSRAKEHTILVGQPPTPSGRILGISPGRRSIGIALIDRGELRRFTVLSSSRGEVDHETLGRRVRAILDAEHPDSIVIEQLRSHRTTSWIRDAVAEIIATAAACELPVVERDLTVARRRMVGTPATRRAVHAHLAHAFPQLARCTRGDQRSTLFGYTDEYWERAFAALTIALAATTITVAPIAHVPHTTEA